MLALISFTLLGLWTAILGFINNTPWEDNSAAESVFSLKLRRRNVRDQQLEAISAASENQIAPSETFEAFKNLWKEIVYGV